MSKLDYGCVVFSLLPEYQMKYPQRVQTTCAGYVLGRYAVLEDFQPVPGSQIVQCGRIKTSKSENKTHATWERGHCLSPAPARFSHFFLPNMLNDFFHHYLGAWNRLEGLQKLNWLPIIKRRDLALLKITQKALYDDLWPDYLRLKFHTVSAYNFPVT